MSTTRDVLMEWLNAEVTVVNPQSFKHTQLKDALVMETYTAKVAEIGDDFIRLSYVATRRKEAVPVNQVVPLHDIKRISVWGDERILHL
jgi:hypothetical protein